ncbi:MAG: hypothetical protein IV100_22360 [Myxococcales bacterium]|nr:hypothetical protein [Myxococcales bacterium]
MRVPFALFVLLSMALVPVRSRASCDSPGDRIHWQFPADGATEVPTNVSIWMILFYTPTLRVTLNDVPLEPASTQDAGRFRWAGHGELLPNTLYVVSVERVDGSPAWSASWTFTTGAGPLASVSQPLGAVNATFESLGPYGGEEWLPLESRCRELVFAQGCFDNGRLGRITATPQSIGPVAPSFWTYEDEGSWERSGVWPTDCGALSMVDQGSNQGVPGSSCRIVSAMDAAGNPMSTQTVCVATPGDDVGTSEASSSGCSSGRLGVGGVEAAGALCILLGASLRIRRRHDRCG